MDIEKLVKYVDLISKRDIAFDLGQSYEFSSDEIAFIREMNEEISKDDNLRETMYEIFQLPPEDRVAALRERGQGISEENKVEKEDNVEEAIAKTFDVDVSEINHHFLNNGKEIFSFYSRILNRNVVLESESKGKSLVDVLKDLQEEVENEHENSTGDDILVDESKRSNIELEMLTKDEIVNSSTVFASLDEEDLIKLHFLIDNYERLEIKGINVENMIFIDKDGKIMEVTLNKDMEVMIAEPMSESSSNSYEQESANVESSELGSMFEDDNPEEIEYVDENLREKDKPKSLVYRNKDEAGFINGVFYVFLAVLVIVLTTFFIVTL